VANKFDLSVFAGDVKCVSIGRLSPDMVGFLVGKCPSLSGIIDSDTDILFWKDRIKHTELHKKDFMSDAAYINCFESIPSIIESPDYLSVHPKDNSISFIKDFSEHVSVAIRFSASGGLSYRTMYPIMDAQLSDYIDKGRAWKWCGAEKP
jgi:hypothetical protein